MQPRIYDKVGYELIQTFQCHKLSERAQDKLHYQLWKHSDTGVFGLALSKNESTGGFSAELILVEDVMQILSQLHKEQKPFHATAFKELFIGKSVNNSSFFGAVLVDQKVIRLHPQTTRLLEVMEDYELWPSRLESIPVSVAVDEVNTSQGNGKQPKKRQGKPMSIVHTEEVSPDADCTH